MELSNQHNLFFFSFKFFHLELVALVKFLFAVYSKERGLFCQLICRDISPVLLSAALLRIPSVPISPLKHALKLLDMTPSQLSRSKQRSFCHTCSRYWGIFENAEPFSFLICVFPNLFQIEHTLSVYRVTTLWTKSGSPMPSGPVKCYSHLFLQVCSMSYIFIE